MAKEIDNIILDEEKVLVVSESILFKGIGARFYGFKSSEKIDYVLRILSITDINWIPH
jgi:hypothetical protein